MSPINSHFWGKFADVLVISRYYPSRTALPGVELFNDSVLEPGTGTHPRVGTLTLADNVVP